jgi:Zn-dependent peptidase ImmA (M78 family)
VAHEIGHLVREAIPELERAATTLGTLLPDAAPRLLKYGRCALSSTGRLTRSDKRELDAHDFAAELLMPREGVRRLIRQLFPDGLATRREITEFVRGVVTVYDVSWEAARRRVTDLDVIAFTGRTNEDLFSTT